MSDSEKGIGILVWSHLREAVRNWPSVFGCEVTVFRPSLARGDSDGLQNALSWPLVAVTLQVEGDYQGRVTLLLPKPDALALIATKRGEKPPEEASLPLDEESQEILKGLLEPFCGAGETTVRRKAQKKATFEFLATQEINKSWELAEDGITVEGWMATSEIGVGEQPAIKAHVWVPAALANVLSPDLENAEEDSVGDEVKLVPGGASKGKVLIVDDLAVTRSLIRQHLERAGYTVIEAETGETALMAATQARPDLVLLDLGLPGMSGFEVCKKMKSDRSGGEVNVIVCSASAQKKDILEAVRSGANDYIVKPFETQTLLQKVGEALTKTEMVA